MDSYQERVERAKATLRQTDFPELVVVESTSICNFRCPHCPSPNLQRNSGFIDLQLFKKIVDEIAAARPETQLWFAFMGEATLWKSLFPLINYAKGKGLKDTRLNTNGSKLDAKMITAIHQSGLDKIIISIDGHSPETFNQIRVGGDYVQVKENALRLLETAQREQWTNPEIWVQMIIMDRNEHEEEAFKKFWIEKGAIVKVRPRMKWGDATEAPNLDRIQIDRDFPCPWLMRQMVITKDGEFAMCGADYEGKHAAGNVKNMTLKEAWNGELRLRREQHMKNDFSFPLCVNCSDWKIGVSDIYQHSDKKQELDIE